MSEAPFSLPALPYGYDDLEPHIDGATMRVHHTGHHQTYTTNLNAALEKLKAESPELAALPLATLLQRLDALPAALKGPIRNSGGGYVNHALFFTQWMAAPGGAGVGPAPPAGSAVAGPITAAFGSVDKMKEDFSAAATTVFGSGWAWLVVDRTGAAPVLRVMATPNQDTPAMTPGLTPILGLDVWEHAYYIKFQNKRAAYIAAVRWGAAAPGAAPPQRPLSLPLHPTPPPPFPPAPFLSCAQWWNVVNWAAVDAMYVEATK